MMENKELPQSIIDALGSGPFNSLTQVLQNEVLEYMTAAEFNEYQGYISDFQSVDHSLEKSIKDSRNSQNKLDQTNEPGHYLSFAKALILIGLVALLSFYLGRVSVNNECPDEHNNLIFAYQDTLGRSLAEDTIQRKLWTLFDKEVL
ncbi:MAG: hypothetical protein P8M34_14835 [Saprospiraceae bacterium]|nr:hypothetical protein [Saprospiraceae bacterium]